jgi:hypothetical protein
MDFKAQDLFDLYDAVNKLMAVLGANGDIRADDKEADSVMNVLHKIDGGVPSQTT